MLRSHLVFASCCTLLLVGGFGCRKPGTLTNVAPLPNTLPVTGAPKTVPKQIAPTPPLAATTPEAPPKKSSLPDIIYLRGVLNRFAQSSSFRANFTAPLAQASASGTVEFVRNKGLHGVMDLPGPTRAEVIVLGVDVYFRSNTSSWVNLGASSEGKQIAALFQSALSLNADNISDALTDTTEITAILNDPTGCRQYIFQPSATRNAMEICVKNDLPVRISSVIDQQMTQVHYRDFDQPMTIAAPK